MTLEAGREPAGARSKCDIHAMPPIKAGAAVCLLVLRVGLFTECEMLAGASLFFVRHEELSSVEGQALMSVSITLHSIQVKGKPSELSAEVYVLIAVATFRTWGLLPALPNLQVFTYGVFENLKKKDPEPRVIDGAPFWGLDGTPEKIKNPDSVGIVVSLMEHDRGVLAQYSTIVKVGGLLSLVTSLGDKDAVSRATRLTRDIGTILAAVKVPIPLFLDDDYIGTQQLKLQKSDVKTKSVAARTLDIGPYGLVFHIRKK